MARVLGDAMSTDLLVVDPAATLGDAAEKMSARGVGAALVLDAGRLRGILTERDLLNAVADRVDAREARVHEWMSEDPVTAPETMTIGRATRIMLARGFRHLPIVNGDRTIGIVSLRDIVRTTARVYPEYEDDAD